MILIQILYINKKYNYYICSPPSQQIDGTSADEEGIGDVKRQEFYLGSVIRLGRSVGYSASA